MNTLPLGSNAKSAEISGIFSRKLSLWFLFVVFPLFRPRRQKENIFYFKILEALKRKKCFPPPPPHF